MRLSKLPIDFVQPGQQQPETEHNFKSMDSENGVHQDHTGHMQEWFSYELKDSDKEAAILRITCFGQDGGRNFDILMNGSCWLQSILTVVRRHIIDMDLKFGRNSGNKDGKFEVKFVAHPGSIAGGIFE